MDVLPLADSWIVGGVFNNLESPSDYCVDIPPHLPEIALVEIDERDSFLFARRLSDVWHEQSFMHTEGIVDFSQGFVDRPVTYFREWTVFTLVHGLYDRRL